MAQTIIALEPAELEALIAKAVRGAAPAGSRENDQALTGEQVCRRYGISRSLLYKLRDRGLPCFHIADSPRYDATEVHAWLRARGAE